MKQDNSSGYTALRSGAGLIEARHTGRIMMTGADRRSYLQGLLTNDIAALTAGTGCYAAMLTAQGRMMSDMRVLELGDALLIDLPRQLTAAIRDHLDRFVFSEDVQVEDVTGTRTALGVYGPSAGDVLVRAGAAGAPPTTLYESARTSVAGVDALVVRGDELGIPGYDIFVDSVSAETVKRALLAAGALPVSDADAETMRIEHGRPRFGADMDGDTIPLEAGLEARAISRSKGCYVGQEVIVRVQDRGQGRVARRLVGLTFDAAASVPASGERITAGDREIGRVTSSTWSPALSRPIAMGYVHRDFVSEGTRLSVGGADAGVVPLPFIPRARAA